MHPQPQITVTVDMLRVAAVDLFQQELTAAVAKEIDAVFVTDTSTNGGTSIAILQDL